jgi:hypothetical protein
MAFALLLLLLGASVFMAFALRRRFPAVWAAWGNPDAWLYLQRTAHDRSFLKFLQDRGYADTGVPAFIRFGGLVRTGWFVVPILFLCSVVALGVSLVHAARFG